MENLSGGCDCDCCDCCDCDGGKTKSTPSLLALGLGWSLTKDLHLRKLLHKFVLVFLNKSEIRRKLIGNVISELCRQKRA